MVRDGDVTQYVDAQLRTFLQWEEVLEGLTLSDFHF